MVCVRVAGEGGGVGSRGRSLSRSAPAHAAGGRAVADASLLPLQPSKAVQATPRALAAGVHATATLPPPPPPHPASIRRCLFISGAGTGIGAATVAAAVGEGYHVFAGVLVAAEGEALVAAHGVGAVTPLPLDVTRADSINAAVSAAAAAMGPGRRLVALVNGKSHLDGSLQAPRGPHSVSQSGARFQNIRDWILKADPGGVPDAKTAWTGMNPEQGGIRLFDLIWENPHPEIQIQSLDFISSMTQCAPFLVAVTAEP